MSGSGLLLGAATSGRPTVLSMERRPVDLTDSLIHRKFPDASLLRHGTAVVVPIAVCVVVAVAVGCTLNVEYFGSASGGGSDIYGLEVNVLKVTLCTLAAATGAGLVRFGVSYFLHCHIAGVFSFAAYVALAIALVVGAYDDVYTSIEARDLSAQVAAVLGGNFEYRDEKFATTFSDISSAGDFYNWMRGPLKTLMTAGPLNNFTNSTSPALMPTTEAVSGDAGVWLVMSCSQVTLVFWLVISCSYLACSDLLVLTCSF